MTRPRRLAGASAEDVARFLAKGSDDACCAWLCRTAGVRTRDQELGLAMAVDRLAPGAFTPNKLLPTPEAMARRVS